MPILATLKANIAASLLGLLAVALLVITSVQTVQIHGFLWFDGLRDDLEECERDKNELKAAAVEAERLNKAQVQRIEADQEKVNAKISSDYSRDLARLRAEFVRRQAAKSNPGSPEAGALPEAPGGVDGEDELRVPADRLLRAAEIELQLMKLQDWVEQQLNVER